MEFKPAGSVILTNKAVPQEARRETRHHKFKRMLGPDCCLVSRYLQSHTVFGVSHFQKQMGRAFQSHSGHEPNIDGTALNGPGFASQLQGTANSSSGKGFNSNFSWAKPSVGILNSPLGLKK